MWLVSAGPTRTSIRENHLVYYQHLVQTSLCQIWTPYIVLNLNSWYRPPLSTVSAKSESVTPSHKASKLRVGFLLLQCGRNNVKPMIVGNAQCPWALRNSMAHLPVSWQANKKGWCSQEIFKEWFNLIYCPEVCLFQTNKQDVPWKEVRVILIRTMPQHTHH